MVMSRRFARLFRPDALRQPTVREDIPKTINGVPIHHRDIIKQIGATEFAPGSFDNLPADHLYPFSLCLKGKKRTRRFLNTIGRLPGDLERKPRNP
jgi:hypothetical protein